MKKIKLTKAVRKVEIHTPFIRLDELLKFSAAVSSGGKAKEVIQQEQVLLNGEICSMRGKKVYPDDKIEYNGILYEVTAHDSE